MYWCWLGDFNHDFRKSDNRTTKFVEDLQNLNLHVHSSAPLNFQGQPSCIELNVSNYSIKLTFPAFQPHISHIYLLTTQ
jgi:hypothetical protein